MDKTNIIPEKMVSNCCGSQGNEFIIKARDYDDWCKHVDAVYDHKAPTYRDLGICPCCDEHCEYIPETEFKNA